MKRILIILTMSLIVVSSYSQSLHVKSFDYVQTDLSARTNKRTDINGNACALLKVRLALPDAKFVGEITGTVEYKTSEYWVYLSPGAKKVNMAISGFLPLDVVFADYGYQKLESLNTYTITVELPANHSQSNQMPRDRFENGAYLEGNIQVGSLMSVGAAIGVYISNVNIEASYLMGLAESEEIFWNASSVTSTKPTSYIYKPYYMGGKSDAGLSLEPDLD